MSDCFVGVRRVGIDSDDFIEARRCWQTANPIAVRCESDRVEFLRVEYSSRPPTVACFSRRTEAHRTLLESTFRSRKTSFGSTSAFRRRLSQFSPRFLQQLFSLADRILAICRRRAAVLPASCDSKPLPAIVPVVATSLPNHEFDSLPRPKFSSFTLRL